MDTKSYYVNSPINSLNYVAVGWSWNLSQIPYLYWGGDNTDSGAECVMFNIESMIDLEDKMPDIMKINLCANWFGSLSRGHVTVECTAYKGGVIVHAWQLKNNEIDIDNRGMFIFLWLMELLICLMDMVVIKNVGMVKLLKELLNLIMK